MKRTAIGLFGILALFFAGCAGYNNGTVKPPQPGQAYVSPQTVTLRGGGTQAFSYTAGDGSSPAVAWSVNGTAGGSASLGTISAAGMYTAPEFPPASNAITVTATQTADTTKSASSAVTLQNPVPQISAVAPASISVGAFNLTVTGSHFAPNSVIMFGATALTTTRTSSTQVTATGTATSGQVGSVSITVKNPDPGTVSSAAFTATVVANSGVVVTVAPGTATLHAGERRVFMATVTGNSNTAVTWSVNNQGGGNAVIGFTDSIGTYQAPATVPNPNTITLTATSVEDTSKNGSATITLVNPVPVITSVSPGSLGVGAFMITVTGTGFVPGSVVNFGGTALTTMVTSSTELVASGTAAASQAGSIPVTVTNPNPGSATSASFAEQVVTTSGTVSASAAARFLEQSTFGPTPALLNQVQQTGFDTLLQSQFSVPASSYPTPAATDSGLGNVQTAFFNNAVNGPDQLRQRVGFALNEIWVVSGNKVSDPTGYTNYVTALNNDALGNYFNVMKDVTLTPAMGHFLDMVNNDKPGTGQHANENYARELMQLFTLGLSQLNADGSVVVDGSGNPVPSYTQDDVMALGRSLTGWTYPTQPGQTLQKHNAEYYGGNMLPFESNHDGGAKTFLGQAVAAGQSTGQELDSVLTIIFNNSNLPPFVCKQLIKKLVTSNPSPAYVQRVSQAFTSGKFNSYGSGKRGDMQATVAAVLLDPEARRGDSSNNAVASDGKLREPVVMVVSVARAFLSSSDGSGFANSAASMSQNLFNSGSVFNFFPPDSLIPQTKLNGPEFAIFNTNTSLARVNFINSMVYGSISGTTKLDFTAVINAGTPDQMLDYLNTLFLHGTMSSSMRQDILTAVSSVTSTDTKNQARTAIYLVASSSQYQVQR